MNNAKAYEYPWQVTEIADWRKGAFLSCINQEIAMSYSAYSTPPIIFDWTWDG